MQHRNLEILHDLAANKSIDTVMAGLVDIQGRLVGKFFEVNYFLGIANKGFNAISYLLANDLNMTLVPGYRFSNWEKGYGDFLLKPDLNRMVFPAWLPGKALVLCDAIDPETNEEVFVSPRTILKNSIQKLKNQGREAVVASELEFYLFKGTDEEIAQKGYTEIKPVTSYPQDYLLLPGTELDKVMSEIRNELCACGIPICSSINEWGPGQMELNLTHDDPLKTADHHTLAKFAIKLIAKRHGMTASFISKWHPDQPGSSSHIHLSLTESGNTIFYDSTQDHGISPIMRAFLAGNLKYTKEFTWFFAPFVNSYKRFHHGSLAPEKITWSVDNRSASYRVCSTGSENVRIECRLGGSDLNPYLAISALIESGMTGINDGLNLAPQTIGNNYTREGFEMLPMDLAEAASSMAQSAFLQSAYGKELLFHLHHNAQWEWSEYQRSISNWEIARYLIQT